MTAGTNTINNIVNVQAGTIVGDVTINYNSAYDLNLPAGLVITGNLTVNAPNATVNNYATVTGEIIVEDVSEDAWNEFASTNSIVFKAQDKTLNIKNGVKDLEIKVPTTLITRRQLKEVKIAEGVVVKVKATVSTTKSITVIGSGTQETITPPAVPTASVTQLSGVNLEGTILDGTTDNTSTKATIIFTIDKGLLPDGYTVIGVKVGINTEIDIYTLSGGDNAETIASKIKDELDSNSSFIGYDISVDGSVVTFTAKTSGITTETTVLFNTRSTGLTHLTPGNGIEITEGTDNSNTAAKVTFTVPTDFIANGNGKLKVKIGDVEALTAKISKDATANQIAAAIGGVLLTGYTAQVDENEIIFTADTKEATAIVTATVKNIE